jgi:adenosylhomocysteine nucleosidase
MIAIVGAMDEEIRAILDELDEYKTETFGPMVFYQGHLSDKDVLVIQSGIGLSMAAMSLSIAISRYPISHVINIGTAGGLLPNQQVLDLVISDKITYHDYDITSFGNPRDFSEHNKVVFYSDSDLIEHVLALRITDRLWLGPMVSGNQFISNENQIQAIKSHYPEAVCVEMEGASIAHVSTLFKIPFIIIRSLSDIVLHHDNHMTFDEYLVKASQRSARLCKALVARIEL